jgi:Domain of unknown function (DUF4352)
MYRLVIALLLSVLFFAAPTQAAHYATHHANYLYLTPLNVKTSTGFSYNSPSAGKVYLIVHGHLVNHDDVQQEIGYGDMNLVVGGVSEDTSFAVPDQPLIGQLLDPGTQITGDVIFEVPVGSHSAILHWAPKDPLWLTSNVHWPVFSWALRY